MGSPASTCVQCTEFSSGIGVLLFKVRQGSAENYVAIPAEGLGQGETPVCLDIILYLLILRGIHRRAQIGSGTCSILTLPCRDSRFG